MKLAVPRMYDWIIYAALLLALVWHVAPQNLPVVVYKTALVALAGVVGYRLDRGLFPYARPHEWNPAESNHEYVGGMPATNREAIIYSACMLRRALIVAAAMIGVTLGL